MKKNSGGSTSYVVLSGTMVDRRRKFFISNCQKRLEKLIFGNAYKVMQTSINVNFHQFINKLFRVSSQSLEFFKVCGGLKFRFEALNIFNYIK